MSANVLSIFVKYTGRQFSGATTIATMIASRRFPSTAQRKAVEYAAMGLIP